MAGPLTQPCARGVVLAASTTFMPCRHPRWVLVTSILGSGLVFADGTALNIALPTIQRELSADVAAVQWIASAYPLLVASLLLLGGALGDRYGRRRLFCVGVVLFAVASVVSAAARSTGVLFTGRALQGVGGALLTPASLAMIADGYQGEARGRAVGAWSAATALMTVVAPLLAGWLIMHASWRWVFWINVPLGAVILVLAIARGSESRAERPGPLDLGGAVVATVGLFAFAYALIQGASGGDSLPRAAIAAGVGAVLLLVFVWVETRAASPRSIRAVSPTSPSTR